MVTKSSDSRLITGDSRQVMDWSELRPGMEVVEVMAVIAPLRARAVTALAAIATGEFSASQGETRLQAARRLWGTKELIVPRWKGTVELTVRGGAEVSITGEPDESLDVLELAGLDATSLKKPKVHQLVYPTPIDQGFEPQPDFNPNGTPNIERGRWQQVAIIALSTPSVP